MKRDDLGYPRVKSNELINQASPIGNGEHLVDGFRDALGGSGAASPS
jgi:hypothetical protein